MSAPLTERLSCHDACTVRSPPTCPGKEVGERRASFNGKLRDQLLDGEVFYTLLEVRLLTGRYRRTYNRIRPHSSLGYRPPAPEAFLPADPVPILVGLTLQVVQTAGAGQSTILPPIALAKFGCR